jgi:hypothetical protein
MTMQVVNQWLYDLKYGGTNPDVVRINVVQQSLDERDWRAQCSKAEA